jgi:hypothetical protein
MSSSGPDVHPAQADQRDPPASPTTILIVVGAAILVVIVFSLEVMHSQFLTFAGDAKAVDTSPGALVRDQQTSYLRTGQVPDPAPPELPTSWKKGTPLDAAIDSVIAKYGKKGQ